MDDTHVYECTSYTRIHTNICVIQPPGKYICQGTGTLTNKC